MSVSINLEVDQAWASRMRNEIPQRLRQGARRGMEVAMSQLERDAIRGAKWNQPGEYRKNDSRWWVTGLSRNTLTGYVVGVNDDQAFSLDGYATTDKFGKTHRADRGVGEGAAGGLLAASLMDQDTFVGILTMYMEYSAYLQRHEDRLYGGKVIERTMAQARGFFWEEVRIHLVRALGF